MQSRNQPTDPVGSNAPDTATSYERAKPEKEAGQGRLDSDQSTPTDRPDQTDKAVQNKQDPERQINGEDAEDERSGRAEDTADRPDAPDRAGDEVDHSMFEEEPDGWDQAPTDIHDPKFKRHSRKEGRGGTP